MSKEPDFTNREILAMFNNIESTLNRIEQQTIKTNGRVTKLEIAHSGLIAKVSTIATLGSAAVVAMINKLI